MASVKGIIITGTSGAGKTTISRELVKRNDNYKLVKAITTRKPRDDDDGQYVYIDEVNFTNCSKCFFISAAYRNTKYAYSIPDIDKEINDNKIPVLLVTPESYATLKNQSEKEVRLKNRLDGFVSFFIDADNKDLDNRLIARDGRDITEADKKRREDDRRYSDEPDYIIQNVEVSDAVDLIERLVALYKVSTPLSEQDIGLYIRNGMLISEATPKNIKGASYDLRLGDEYYYRGQIRRLKDQNLRLTIEPYDYALASSKEEICLPKDVIAHFGLTVGLFCQGIILSNGQQVDPGFRGKLFCLLFNTSNQPVTIKRGAHYSTIEFEKMNNFASKYKGQYQEKRDIIDVLPANAMQGGLSELKREIEELKHESKNMQSIYISVIAIVIAAISILLIIK